LTRPRLVGAKLWLDRLGDYGMFEGFKKFALRGAEIELLTEIRDLLKAR
jgi:large-conductance mechanosensitive channel